MDNQREKDRDRSRRGDRPSRFSDAARDRSNDRGGSDGRRLFVSNIPYEFRWTELKDLFKEKVGDVAYVELFNDDNGKPRGCGVVEFTNSEAMKKALFVMHRYELNGRKLVLKEETGNERNRANPGRSGGGGGGGGGGGRMRDDKDGWGLNKPREPENFNTYGLSLAFLESINVQPPLVKKVFVANLDYKADRAKIKEVFKMAGKVHTIDLAIDKDGNSRGFAVIEYDHPVEAVQAISMFDKQMLYDRRMTVRMDRGVSDKSEIRLPEGLKSIGVGLGPNGEPLRNVAQNLPQNTAQNNLNLASTGTSLGAGVLGAVPTASVALNGLGSQLAANPLGTNSALGGSLGIQLVQHLITMERENPDGNIMDLVAEINDLPPEDRLKLLTLKLFNQDGRPTRLRKKHLPAPWLTDDLKCLLEEKKVAKARLKHDNSEEALNIYKTLRNRCNTLCRDAQKRFCMESDDSTKALSLTGLGALQNQLLQQSLTANDLATVLSQAQAANVNSNSLGLGSSDLGGSVLGNSGMGSGMGSGVLGPNSTLSSGPLSGSNRQMGGSVTGQGYGREQPPQSSGRDKPSDMVMITNLPSTVTWQLIREKFSECGDVKFAEMTASDTAIVRFHKEWDAERAVKMFDRTRIDGRTIDVRFF